MIEVTLESIEGHLQNIEAPNLRVLAEEALTHLAAALNEQQHEISGCVTKLADARDDEKDLKLPLAYAIKWNLDKGRAEFTLSWTEKRKWSGECKISTDGKEGA